ncbi:hypothetical protein JCGZ_11820 [Jatropha curcas]|uniref:Uncharacterized protein n=1 Tax=Jatropha curcas TaxID=180498 RepID=A0A067KHX0_JATCU|nr:hypothetical protein JCGZ_11820 [Jatropha curcas]
MIGNSQVVALATRQDMYCIVYPWGALHQLEEVLGLLQKTTFSEAAFKDMEKANGTKWSLIAGRLPGRTPNDVKNFWNTHMRRKLKPSSPYCKEDDVKGKTVKIIKPRPRKLSNNTSLFTANVSNNLDNGKASVPVAFPPLDNKDDNKINNQSNTTNTFAGANAPTFFEGESSSKQNDWWSNFSFDEEILNLFHNEEQELIYDGIEMDIGIMGSQDL